MRAERISCARNENRLKAMKLPSLVYRRYRGYMTEVYKYLHGMYSVPYDSLLQEAPPCALRGHNYKWSKDTAIPSWDFSSFPSVSPIYGMISRQKWCLHHRCMYSREDWTNSGTTISTHWSQDTDYWSAKRSSWPNLKDCRCKSKGNITLDWIVTDSAIQYFCNHQFSAAFSNGKRRVTVKFVNYQLNKNKRVVTEWMTNESIMPRPLECIYTTHFHFSTLRTETEYNIIY